MTTGSENGMRALEAGMDPSIVFTVRLDPLLLAEALSGMLSQGLRPRTRSEMMKVLLQFVVDVMRENEFDALRPEGLEEAYGYLIQHGMAPQSALGKRQMGRALQADALKADGFRTPVRGRFASGSPVEEGARIAAMRDSALEFLRREGLPVPTEGVEQQGLSDADRAALAAQLARVSTESGLPVIVRPGLEPDDIAGPVPPSTDRV